MKPSSPAAAALVLLTAMLLLAGCARNNLLLGEVHADVGGHPTTVTDCFRVHLPEPSASSDIHTWAPCRDSQISLRRGDLQVNGRHYGLISAGAPIVVDHGVVSVSGRELQPVQQ